MKQLTKYNRVAGYLNRCYDLINADFFGGELEKPVITIQSTPRAYGHVSVDEIWTVGEDGAKELNIGAGTLARPIESLIATLLHECCHIYNMMKGISDVSRGNTYHNKRFKETAEARKLIIKRSEIYGWSITEPSEELIDWILLNDLTDIPMNRNEFGLMFGGNGGGKTAGGEGEIQPRRSSYRKYICPECQLIARTTRDANLTCTDCGVEMARA